MSVFISLLCVASLLELCCIGEALAKNIHGKTTGRPDDNRDGSSTSSAVKVMEHHKEFWKVAVHSMECTKRKQGKLWYDVELGRLLLCYDTQWRQLGWSTKSPKKGKLPISCLDAKFKRLDKGKGDGLYWINPSGVNDLRNSFLVYCDMTTAGGGWTLVAKVTNDYAWICPEKKGGDCWDSAVDPITANLFHPVHTRDFVNLTTTADEHSGIHLKNSIIRKMFENGRQSIRFTFVTSAKGWKPSEDAYAAFNLQKANKMFIEKSLADYSRKNQDYTWNVIRHERKNLKFAGSIICWGMEVDADYRYYDQGLHVGTPSKDPKRCHLDNDENQVMLKSHYARVDHTGRTAKWDRAQFGFLRSNVLQAPCQRIALWVR